MFTTLRNIIGIIFPVVAIIVSLAVILRKRKENLPKAQNAIVHTEEGGLFLNQILSQDNTKKFIAIEDSAFLHDLIVKNISDNINSTFSKLYIPPDLNTSETIIYYTVIDTDTSDYQLTINEKTIKL